MSGERVVGTALLAVTLVFGLALSIMPLGETWVDDPDTGTRQTETYGMFSKVRETTPAGEAGDGVGTQWYYTDPVLDESGGITFLRAMGPLMAAALVLTLVAFVLTVVPKTSDRRFGGWFALPAAVLFLSSIVMVVLGTAMHADMLSGPGPQVDWSMAASTIAVLGILTITIPAGMGLVRIRRQEQPATYETWTEDAHSTAQPAAHAAEWDGQENWQGQENAQWNEQPAQAGAWDQGQEWNEQPAQGHWEGQQETLAETGTWQEGDQEWDGTGQEWHGGNAVGTIPETGTRAWVAGRNLRCPDCSTVVTTGFGVVPICPSCEFGADYAGPAAPPVPARAVPF